MSWVSGEEVRPLDVKEEIVLIDLFESQKSPLFSPLKFLFRSKELHFGSQLFMVVKGGFGCV